jgi:hypothetical protein
MQGIGAVTGSLFVVILIHFARQGNTICDRSIEPGVNSAGVNPYALDSVWRAFLFIGLIFNVMILLYRWLIVVESEEGAKKIQKRKANRSAATKKLNLWTIFGFYGTRVIATGGCWFIWDIAFYVRICSSSSSLLIRFVLSFKCVHRNTHICTHPHPHPHPNPHIFFHPGFEII